MRRTHADVRSNYAIIAGILIAITWLEAVAIWTIDGLLSNEGAAWWPLIPGGILTVIGASRIAGIRDLGIHLVPGALIVVGLLLRPGRDRTYPTSGSATSTSADGAGSPAGGEIEE